MKRNTLLTILFSAALAATALGTAAPAAAAIDRASMTLSTRYVLKAALNYSLGTISVQESIVIVNRSGSSISKVNLSVMPRAFGELTSLSNVTVDSRSVSARWTNNSNLEVQLGRIVADDASATIRLKFAVRATSVIGTSLEGRLSKANGIMQVSHWFPIVSNGHPTRYPGDSQYTRVASKIRLELTTESSLVRIAAPGVRVSSSGRYHVYEMTNTRDFAFGASPSYKVATGSAAGVAISAYYTTGSGVAALNSAAAAITKYESLFGQYQWSRFVIAQTGRSGSGNEYPGIVFLGAATMGLREVVAHEVAHQWWYAMAGNDQMREPWLDEGIAEFVSTYFFGEFEPFVSARPVNTAITEFPDLPAPVTSDDPDSYDQTIYYKSAAFLNGLRSRIGTTRFFAGLRDMFTANRNGVMTTREFYNTMLRYGASPAYMDQFIRL